jgi:hypothetical protein
MPGGRRQFDQAAVGLHDRRFREPQLVAALEQPTQVTAEQRRQRRVDLGRRRAFVFTKGADDLMRQRHVDAGQGVGDRVADPALVLGVAVRVQQRHRDRLGLGFAKRLDQLAQRCVGQLHQWAVGGHPLGDADPALGRRQWRGPGGTEPIQLGPGLAAELDQIGEAVGRDERGPGARALEQRVGGDRHPVRELADMIGAEAGKRERRLDGGLHPLGLIGGGGRGLRGDQPPVIERQHGV